MQKLNITSLLFLAFFTTQYVFAQDTKSERSIKIPESKEEIKSAVVGVMDGVGTQMPLAHHTRPVTYRLHPLGDQGLRLGHAGKRVVDCIGRIRL